MKATLLFLLLTLLVLSGCGNSKTIKREKCIKKYNKGLAAVEAGKNGSAVNLLSDVRINCIGGIENEDSLYFFLGKAYMQGKKYGEARLEYRFVAENYPHSIFREESMYRMAYCSYKSTPRIELDNKILLRAQREFTTFIANFPESKWVDSCRIYGDTIYENLVEKEMQNAAYYEIIKKHESAVIYYESILRESPSSKRVPEATLKMCKNLVAVNRFKEAEKYLAILESENRYATEIANIRDQIVKKKEATQKKRKK